MNQDKKDFWMQFHSRAKRSAAWLKARWLSITPGIRYALVYLVAMISITSAMWWWFNPARIISNLPPVVVDPAPAVDEDQDIIDHDGIPEPDDEDAPPVVWPNRPAFNPETDWLDWPLSGKVLPAGRPFANVYSGDTYGINIEGEQGKPIGCAWHGVVEEVVPPLATFPGQVTVSHGDWQTIYINLEQIKVQRGQTVVPGQSLGVLAERIYYWDAYEKDYLGFQLYYLGEPRDPTLYLKKGEQPS